MRAPGYALLFLLVVPELVMAQAKVNTGPWDVKELSSPPKVTILKEEPGLLTVTYTNVPYLGKPTQVFAYLAIPILFGCLPIGHIQLGNPVDQRLALSGMIGRDGVADKLLVLMPRHDHCAAS